MRVSHRRREGIEDARDQSHHGPEAEQEQNRQQVGEGGHRLHQVERRGEDSLRALRVERERAQRESDPYRARHRDCDQRQRVHRLGPVADDEHVEDREEREHRQPPPRDRPRHESQHGKRDRPGQPVQQLAHRGHRHVDCGRERAEGRADRVHAPLHEHVEPRRDRHHPGVGVLDEPAGAVLHRQEGEGGQDQTNPDPVERAARCEPAQATSPSRRGVASARAHRCRCGRACRGQGRR